MCVCYVFLTQPWGFSSQRVVDTMIRATKFEQAESNFMFKVQAVLDSFKTQYTDDQLIIPEAEYQTVTPLAWQPEAKEFTSNKLKQC